MYVSLRRKRKHFKNSIWVSYQKTYVEFLKIKETIGCKGESDSFFFQIGLFVFCSLYFGANIINLSIWQIIIFELTATASFHLDKFKEFYSIYPDFNVDLCLQKH